MPTPTKIQGLILLPCVRSFSSSWSSFSCALQVLLEVEAQLGRSPLANLSWPHIKSLQDLPPSLPKASIPPPMTSAGG